MCPVIGPAPVAQPDHLIVAAARLEEGIAYVESLLQTKLQVGGQHIKMGTHNALLGLGPRCYLEVIAVDPGLPVPSRPRWFGLDNPEIRSRIMKQPRFLHWVVRVPGFNIPGLDVEKQFGRITSMSRGNLHWKITIPDDGSLPGDGCLPSLIQWPGSDIPSTRLPDSGYRLKELKVSHPEPACIVSSMAHLGLGTQIRVEKGQGPGISAVIAQGAAAVELTSLP